MKTQPQIFGILNCTPDSFSDGGQFVDTKKAITYAKKMFDDGADFVDVGGESTRPNAEGVSPEAEWDRVKEVLKYLIKKYPNKISLDTRHESVARKFLEMGGTILNDVSGFQHSEMRELAVEFKPTIIINHFPGVSIKEVHNQKINSAIQVRDDLLKRKKELIEEGFPAKKIILDPGIGFGKTPELNQKLLKFAELIPDEKVLIGYSRKRFLGNDRFEIFKNLEAAVIAYEAETTYIRVHDVAEHKDLLINPEK